MELLNREILVLIIYFLFLLCMLNLVLTVALFYTMKKHHDKTKTTVGSIIDSLWPSELERFEAGIAASPTDK